MYVAWKRNFFRLKLLLCRYDVFLLCESWLRNGVLSSELFNDQYVIYRKDRDNSIFDKKDGGGCLIAVRKNFISNRLGNWELDTDIWVSIDHANGMKTFLNVKYMELHSSFVKWNTFVRPIVSRFLRLCVSCFFYWKRLWI